MSVLQVLDAVSGALIGSFTWLNLGFVAPTLTYVYRRRLPVRLRTDSWTCSVCLSLDKDKVAAAHDEERKHLCC